MSNSNSKAMRDILIEQIYLKMKKSKDIFFLSADVGAPMLDNLRKDFSDRFINVGIAEQNLINISTGLALEGFTIYAYGIAPFLIMRPYEQIRVNLSILSQLRKININLIGIGSGLSYEVSGPTHHCLEDIGIIRMLPNISLISPSDNFITEKIVDYTLEEQHPKYIRLEGKPLPQIYNKNSNIKIKDGFKEFFKGDEICIVSTGYMTHKAIRICDKMKKDKINIGVVDVFFLKFLNVDLFCEKLKKYKMIITLEEAFINKGGLDSLVIDAIDSKGLDLKIKRRGLRDCYVFNVGSREYLHNLYGLDDSSIIMDIKESLKKIGVCNNRYCFD